MEEAVWRFVDQKWKDSLNVVAADPIGIEVGREAKWLVTKGSKSRRLRANTSQLRPMYLRPMQRSHEVACPRSAEDAYTKMRRNASLWECKAFGDIAPEERDQIMRENKMCLFHLLAKK